jgi:hypothetical protein
MKKSEFETSKPNNENEVSEIIMIQSDSENEELSNFSEKIKVPKQKNKGNFYLIHF